MRAIDMHVHVPRQPGLPEIEVESHLRSYFRVKSAPGGPGGDGGHLQGVGRAGGDLLGGHGDVHW